MQAAMISDEEALRFLQKNPAVYGRDILGVEFEPYQERALKVIEENERIGISACHDVGKTFLMSVVVPWFLTCFKFSKVITTAPTYLQVETILWAAIRTRHARAKVPLGGDLTLTKWKLDSEWFALGFTPKNEVTDGEGQGTASSFQGHHAEGGILIIFDEATGIPKNVWTMAEGLMTQAHVKFAAIGNPTSRSAEFFRCFSDPSWAKVFLNCFDSPNLIANGIVDMDALMRELDLLRSMQDEDVLQRMKDYRVVKPYLLSTSWVMGRALKWGVTHPLFVSKVLGKFPEEGDDTLIPLGIVEDAQRRAPVSKPGDRKTIGIDVARFGSDASVLTGLHGHRFIKKRTLVKRDTMQIAGAALAMALEMGGVDIIVVDETGIGSGVVDALKEAIRPRDHFLHGIEIRGVQFGAAFDKKTRQGLEDTEKYVNIKAKMFDLLAQDLKGELQLGAEDVYLDELPTILYDYDSKGRMYIESKDEYKKRTGRGSPDHADSLALANYGRYGESKVASLPRLTGDAPATRASSLASGDNW